MKRQMILASHSQLAAGMKASLNFFTSDGDAVIAFTAYEDNQPIDQKVADLIAQFDDDTELLVFTDVASGSVNQQFARYLNRPHYHLIAGMNLPLVMAFALLPDEYLSHEQILDLIAQAKEQLVYVNDSVTAMDDDDE